MHSIIGHDSRSKCYWFLWCDVVEKWESNLKKEPNGDQPLDENAHTHKCVYKLMVLNCVLRV